MSEPALDGRDSTVAQLVRWCTANPLVVLVAVGLLALGGVVVAPFPWDLRQIPRLPVPVDAIPDTGDNQQIVFTEWAGRSPQDVEDQITYPLTAALLGVPGVESVRSTSMFGFSSVHVIFADGVDFHWSRSRLLEKLASLAPGTLPEGVRPALGPDATALGQVFWYTLEGWSVAPEGEAPKPVGGFDLAELRTVQDWQVRTALSAVEGVAEVASIGGFVREFQVELDPDALRAHGVSLQGVFEAVMRGNRDVGARTLELNRVEYVVRGLGQATEVEDLESIVVKASDGTPITLGRVARVLSGPALRRGVLDKAGAEAVGGVVVARFGSNPLEVVEAVKQRIDELAPALPERVLDDGTRVQVKIVPFYDRGKLIGETLGTLEDALRAQVLVTAAVVLVMVARLRAGLLLAGLVPLVVLVTFLGMKLAGVDANVVALSGIAIAIGTIVDVGIVMVESIGQHTRPDDTPSRRLEAVRRGAAEVGGAVATAVATTVVGFLPVFAMVGAEGKLFTPLAWTKTLALAASITLGLTVLPTAARFLLGVAVRGVALRALGAAAVALGLAILFGPTVGVFALVAWGLVTVSAGLEERHPRIARLITAAIAALVLGILALSWEPAGPARDAANLGLAAVLLGVPLAFFWALERVYEPVLRWCLGHKVAFLCLPVAVCASGLSVWLGFERVFGWLPASVRSAQPVAAVAAAVPGLEREFMPSLDEGSFLLMPVTMPHASIGEALELLQLQDRRIAALPEVASVVGKIGRVESALDPAPISMVETVIEYHPEYRTDRDGRVLTFEWDSKTLSFRRDERGELIPDPDGRPFRMWRAGIDSPRDIWNAVAAAADVPGMTTASMLQPIETRRIMLQTGLRAPIGLKVFAPDLERLERASTLLEETLREAPGVDPRTVFADRVQGKPYLELDLDRERIARHGLSVEAVQRVIEVAVGGRWATTVIDGRERIAVSVRYPRELRHTPEALERVLVDRPDGAQVPLGQLMDLRYTAGPQSIRSEETELVSYVTFGSESGSGEIELADSVRAFLDGRVASGELRLPEGVRYRLAGDFENQQRAAATLRVVIPVALALIFILLQLQFRRVWVTAIVFGGVAVAWAGGFCLLWLWGREGFLEVQLFGVDLATLFRTGPTALSVAVWVGFLALFGIATDDGVLMATYLEQRFASDRPGDRDGIREAVVGAAMRRVRPCLMTTATTTLALIPVLTSSGRGADVMVPMAIPTVGGMLVVLLTIFLTPTLYCWVRELQARRSIEASR